MRQIPILMYHNIGVPDTADKLPKLYVSPAAFNRQMALIRLLGFQGLSMREAMPYLRGEQSDRRVVAITFDDGYADNIERALPILRRHGHTATCYFVSQNLGGHNSWDADKIDARKPIMDADQLRTWSAAGMEVGAHTRTHPHMTKCDDAELAHEAAGSKVELESLAQSPVTQFCYPYGALDQRVVQAVKTAGFEAATTTVRGSAIPGQDLYTLPRIKMTGRHLLKALLPNIW